MQMIGYVRTEQFKETELMQKIDGNLWKIDFKINRNEYLVQF